MDDKFLGIIAEILKIDPGMLREDSTAETVPGWDSLNHWAVISELEDRYQVEFTMNEATEFENLGHIYRTLTTKLAQKK